MNFLSQWVLKRKEEKAVKFMDKYVSVTSEYMTSTRISYLALDFSKKKSFFLWLTKEENKRVFIAFSLLFFGVIAGFILFPHVNIFLYIMLIFLGVFILHVLTDIFDNRTIDLKIKNKLRKNFNKHANILRKIEVKETDTESIVLIKTTSVPTNKNFVNIMRSPWLANLILRLDNIQNYTFGKQYFNKKRQMYYETIQECLLDTIQSIRNHSYQSELRYQSFLVKEQIRLDITKTILNEVIKSCGDFNYLAIDVLIEQNTFTKQMYQDTIQPLLIELDNLYNQKENETNLEEEHKRKQKQAVMEDSKIVLKEVTDLARKL